MTGINWTENRVLMQQARESLRGRWGLAIGAWVVFVLISVALSSIPKAGGLFSLIITGPMSLGLAIFSLALSRDRDPKFEQIFQGFQKFGVSLGVYLLSALFILLWALLLIIPGIIAGLSYSMIYFIIAEDDSIGPMEALRKSKKMMYGYKWKLFCMYMRFLGWALLCILTLGIGFLWLMPYMGLSHAKFYDDLLKISGPQVRAGEATFAFEE